MSQGNAEQKWKGMVKVFDFLVNGLARLANVKRRLNGNPHINKVAEVLAVDMKGNQWNLRALLKGETEPIHLSFDYAMKWGAVTIKNIKVDKDWLNGLVDVLKARYPKIDGKIKLLKYTIILQGEGEAVTVDQGLKGKTTA